MLMAAFTSSASLRLLPFFRSTSLPNFHPGFISLPLCSVAKSGRNFSTLACSSSTSSFDDLEPKKQPHPRASSKNSALSTLIQEIEPLDVTVIQKDVPPTTLDAMKRTISGMLGLLPSGQFQVVIDGLWESLSKLLVSSMMTGYTLRNAEYRLCLERNLLFNERNFDKKTAEDSKLDSRELFLDSSNFIQTLTNKESPSNDDKITEDLCKDMNIEEIGEMSPEVQQYILHLRSCLSNAREELFEVKRKCAALQMQHFVGEEKNDLLDYLRSLLPEKVAELSETTSPGLKDTIHSVVHGLLATLSPKMHSKVPPHSENIGTGAVLSDNEDCAELVENTALHLQPLISLSRDYLARLLFWCMLLGHYLRGLEHRLELVDLLSSSCSSENGSVSR